MKIVCFLCNFQKRNQFFLWCHIISQKRNAFAFHQYPLSIILMSGWNLSPCSSLTSLKLEENIQGVSGENYLLCSSYSPASRSCPACQRWSLGSLNLFSFLDNWSQHCLKNTHPIFFSCFHLLLKVNIPHEFPDVRFREHSFF